MPNQIHCTSEGWPDGHPCLLSHYGSLKNQIEFGTQRHPIKLSRSMMMHFHLDLDQTNNAPNRSATVIVCSSATDIHPNPVLVPDQYIRSHSFTLNNSCIETEFGIGIDNVKLYEYRIRIILSGGGNHVLLHFHDGIHEPCFEANFRCIPELDTSVFTDVIIHVECE